MSGEFLLDTNRVIALTLRDDSVLEKLQDDVTVFLPSIVLGELCFGAYRSGRVQENLARVAELATSSTVLDCDASTARHYGRIKNGLREAGRPIPENDVWIAALAQQYGLILASRDAHFDHIEDLEVQAWR